MASVLLEIDMPSEIAKFRLPEGVHQRLQDLLDRQDLGIPLTSNEQEEAEGLVELSEWLSLLGLRAHRHASGISFQE